MPRLFGLFVDLVGRPVLVVGGGSVAERKITALLKTDASITVIAQALTPRIRKWAARGYVNYHKEAFCGALLDDYWLVVAATDDRDLNQRVADAAAKRRLFANVVDDAALSSFHTPAVVDRGLLQIAISTGGAAPALGRSVRAKIELTLDESIGSLVALVSRFRTRIKTRLQALSQRRQFYDRLAESAVATRLRQHDTAGAEMALVQLLEAPQPRREGFVSLVGAGPGAAGLMTVQGLRALQAADVILHDRLVSTDILELARRDAERIEVGKKAGDHRFKQAQINALMERYASAGQHVVRLKGGDPFIFGRGGEELEHLRACGIRYEVIPGITAASACAAYAGVPLTHRDHAQSVRFVTAHCQQSCDTLDWQTLAQERQTLAIYMGVQQLSRVRQQLLANGRSARTPFVLVENGSRREQRVVSGVLDDMPALAQHHRVASPALVILGEVAALGKSLAWFGAPAQGGNVTRAVTESDGGR